MRSLRSASKSRSPGIYVLLCCTVGIILEITATYSTPRYLHENLVNRGYWGIDVLDANILLAIITSGLHDDLIHGRNAVQRNVSDTSDRPAWLERVD